MIRFTLFLFVLLATSLAAVAQEPVFTWGAAIDREPREFENMRVVGLSPDSGFYAIYTEAGKTTLERYNQQNQRLWATVLLPRSPENQPIEFQDAVVLEQKVYLVSSRLVKGVTTIYAQEITANGNYNPQIQPLLQAKHGGKLQLTTSGQNNLLLATLTDEAKKTGTATVLGADLKPRFSKTFSARTLPVQTLLLDNGTAYMLLKSLSTEPSTKSFLLYRLQANSSKPNEMAIGHEQYRPMQALLTTTAAQDVVVTGYYSSTAEAAKQAPVPEGTFYFRFGKDSLKQRAGRFTAFNKAALQKHTSYKPEKDSTRWLRQLQLKQLVPVPHGGVIALGEVDHTEADQTTYQEDVLAVMLEEDGTPYYTTTIYKKQANPNNNEQIGSFMATNSGNYLQLLYLDFEYNFSDDDKLIIAGKNASNKEPVLITVLSNGEQQVKPLHKSQTGREQQRFYLRPTSAFQVSDKEFIVLGIGLGYYKYGRLKFR
ncbi:hypothetical protein FVR03_20705 [Pontibacter qinzhouensis]|uniref:Uncharacterized protein n=1 Tax=Pontibacter qinzhouensis TaxID=2603253 RepID=A0A5C8J2E7_9BACT|nr:hypothetical protein [Pontibacter qinzhouensis]TXK28423.1 hypothetical protein FVR03_20705 [Pontibacter qinzhouensis]